MAMEQWQIEVIQNILETKVSEVEKNQRVYISSTRYGSDRYHLVDRQYDTVQIEQIDASEKWSKRVTFAIDEIPAVLKTLLTWHLADVREREKYEKKRADSGDIDESVDAHLF